MLFFALSATKSRNEIYQFFDSFCVPKIQLFSYKILSSFTTFCCCFYCSFCCCCCCSSCYCCCRCNWCVYLWIGTSFTLRRLFVVAFAALAFQFSFYIFFILFFRARLAQLFVFVFYTLSAFFEVRERAQAQLLIVYCNA